MSPRTALAACGTETPARFRVTVLSLLSGGLRPVEGGSPIKRPVPLRKDTFCSAEPITGAVSLEPRVDRSSEFRAGVAAMPLVEASERTYGAFGAELTETSCCCLFRHPEITNTITGISIRPREFNLNSTEAPKTPDDWFVSETGIRKHA